MNRLFAFLVFLVLSQFSFSQNLNAFLVKNKIKDDNWTPYISCNVDIVFTKVDDISQIIVNNSLTYSIIDMSKSESKNEFGTLTSYACYDQNLDNCIITIQSYDKLKTFDITIEYSELSLSYTCKNK